ncbi:hypothetical protein [Lactobacillus paragasseri]|uniref:hypothetical protein n=1 Tax=Lactobacillus paragasseri TaxID=2107999 RepID=UPI00217D4A3A|nr:hypothetical protein [Lactobacillus paragasseri]UWI43311.1 hypothetical protein HR119_03620 [Lactobacillus paragasseri]UWI44554.1 hypothetical protein HR117_00900 [Lactobacillus paragasseri]
MSHIKKVKNLTKPKGNVRSEPAKLRDIIYIDFTKYPNWTETVKIKEFNNCLKDVNEASRHFFFIVDQLIPDIESYGEKIFSQKAKHCHILYGEAANKARKVIRKIHGKNVLDDSTEIWELAAKTEEIRLIGVFVNEKVRKFYPLFIDHHHLIYPSLKYNQLDYKKYSFTKENIKSAK